MSEVSSPRKLLSAGALMATGTMISRILGMVRVALIAFIFANGTRQADILGIATMVPNALYILFAGGALNTVLVPQIVRAIKNDEDGGEAFTNRIMTAFMLVITAVAVIVTLAAPLVTAIYTDGAWREPGLEAQYASLISLTYLTLPQIFFYGLFFLLAQVLNARDKFGPMMWAPIANNVISILVLSIYFFVWGNLGDKSTAFTTPQILLLGIGSTLGIAMQTVVLIPFLKRVGFKLRPRFDLKGTGLGHTFSLTKWTLGFVAVNQLALVVVNRLATTATAGGVGAGVNVYSNAHLLWILPHSLVTTSLATAMLPNASRLAASNDMRGVAKEMLQTVRLALIFIVPATALFLSMASPAVNLLFGHGRGSSDADWVGWALMAFAVGLIPFTVQFVCLRTFYAMENTRTPFLLQIGIASVNALGAILFVWWVNDPSLVATALAASYSLAYVIGVFVSWQLLRRQLPDLEGRQLVMHIVRLLLGAAPGAVLAYFFGRLMASWLPGKLGALIALTVGGLLILGCTFLIGRLLKVREMSRLGELLRRRRGKAKEVEESSDPTVLPSPPVETTTAGGASAALAETSVAKRMVDDEWDEESEPPDPIDDDPPTTIRPRPVAPGEFTLHDLFRRPADEYDDTEDPFGDGPSDDEPARAVEDDAFDGDAETDDAMKGYALGDEPHDDDHEADDDDEPEAGDAVEDSIVDDFSDWDIDRTVPNAGRLTIGEAGLVLGARYQLEKLIEAREDSETWLAHDQVLSRDVVAHVLAEGDPQSEALLGAARRGAAATDSRFLRVLDVDELEDDSPVGAYAVCEYADGRTLTEILSGGPMPENDGAFIVREVADALSPMHDQGLFHERLDPDHILITPVGGVRIVGFGVESVLQDSPTERPWSQRESDDVVALATILRATQSGEWSNDTVDEAPELPMSNVWRAAFDGRIATMAALSRALPDSNATALLEAKMGLAQRAKREPVPQPKRSDEEEVVVREEHVEHRPVAGTGTEASPRRSAASLRIGDRPPERPRFLLWVLVLLAVIALIIGLIATAINNGASVRQDPLPPGETQTTPTGGPDGESAPPGEAGPLDVAKATDFDPEIDGGNGEEFPDTVGNVIDGDPDTTWTTMRYLNYPKMGRQKPGVGFVLDLGEDRTVTNVEIVFLGAGPTNVELRVPKGAEPSMRSQEDWEPVAENRPAEPGAQQIALENVKTRYLLVYVTELPPVEGGFRAEISGVTVTGY